MLPAAELEAPPDAVLEAYGLRGARAQRISVGLINRTFVVTLGPRRVVLQRLHPALEPDLSYDIDAITAHLARAGVPTPRPVPTATGDLWLVRDGVWRALTYLEGRVVHEVSEPHLAAEAAGLAARFHRALAGFEHVFRFVRPGAHDTPAHLAHLRAALDAHASHPRHAEVAPLAEQILAQGRQLRPIGALPRRIIHGDLKITNVLFDDALERAVALLDLDTLAHGTVAVELGDALRSWCNRAGEDVTQARFDEATFEAALRGYAAAAPGLLAPEEARAIPAGLRTIATELAARFCADALEERYFGWDPARFPSRSEHARVRAAGQLSLARAVAEREERLDALVAEVFGLGRA